MDVPCHNKGLSQHGVHLEYLLVYLYGCIQGKADIHTFCGYNADLITCLFCPQTSVELHK